MSDLASVLVITLMIAVLFGGRILAGSLDHDRIRQYIRKAGGKVVDVNRLPFGPGWFGSRERIYEVKYETRHGKIRTATCKTSMFSGIYWNVHAPGLMESNEPITPEADEPTTTAAGPITCLACGALIPERQTACPKCGWSYKGE